MSFWDRAISAGRSIATTAIAATPIGAAVALTRSSRNVGVAVNGFARGAAGGIAGLFGERAQEFAERHVGRAADYVTGVNMNNLSESEQQIASVSRGVGTVAGVGATFLVPGGIAVRGASLALRGTSLALRTARVGEIAGVTRAAEVLTQSVTRMNNARGISRVGVELGNDAIDNIVFGGAAGLLAGDDARTIGRNIFSNTIPGFFAEVGGIAREVIFGAPAQAAAPSVRNNQTLETIFNLESPNMNSSHPPTQTQLQAMAREINTVVTTDYATVTDEQRQNFTNESAQLMQPLLNKQLLQYTYDADVIRFQAAAKAAGLYTGEVDGLAGPLTRAAMERLLPQEPAPAPRGTTADMAAAPA